MIETPSSYGRIVWREYITHDLESAKQFYGGLFGWTWKAVSAGEGEPPYTVVLNGTDGVAGMLSVGRKPGTPYWTPYVHVEEVDRVFERAIAHGATAMLPPEDVPGVGRIAFLRDPQGAFFYLFRAVSPDKPETAPQPGEFRWDQLETSDTNAATAFYTEVLGWEIVPAGPISFISPRPRNYPMAVMHGVPEEIPPHWLPYVMVADLEATNAKAKGLGGEIIERRIEVPGSGAFALLKDRDGARFMLAEMPFSSKV